LFYDLFLYHGGESVFNPFGNTTAYQLHWLKQRNNDYDRYFIGEKYRRLGQLAKADSRLAGQRLNARQQEIHQILLVVVIRYILTN
jgi:hypothetical protein